MTWQPEGAAVFAKLMQLLRPCVRAICVYVFSGQHTLYIANTLTHARFNAIYFMHTNEVYTIVSGFPVTRQQHPKNIIQFFICTHAQQQFREHDFEHSRSNLTHTHTHKRKHNTRYICILCWQQQQYIYIYIYFSWHT